MRVAGVVLVVLGALGLYFRSIPYTQKEKVLDLGPIQATAEQTKEIAIPPIVSAGVLGAGALLLLAGGRKRR
ncbi:MAG: hypothetical protein L0Y66_25160 [Myxococcaceae bacterium]|nr:hypothetical protein [Myxococcaceae bacterium]MCI0669433.1 hypothetical protein [Myxococcaceae bacterium]